MLKGHVQIDLHNHNTGLKDRIEKDNLITNAVNFLTPYFIAGAASLTQELLPLYCRKLGGVMLFNKNLTSNANNVHFPVNAQLVGWAGQTQTFDPDMGSLNTQESGVVNDGYKLVWDFATNQANGIIRSVALTDTDYNSSYACNPHRTYTNYYSHRLYTNEGANYNCLPLLFKDNYFYFILDDGNLDTASTTHTASIYKQYVPINNLKIADGINSYGRMELVDTIEIETSINVAQFWRFYSVDESAGYIYFPYVAQYGEGQDGIIKFRKLSITSLVEDGEVVLSNEVTLHLDGLELTNWIYATCRIVGDKCYALGFDRKTVYVINIADASDVIPVTLPGDFVNTTYQYDNFYPMSPRGCVNVCYCKNEGGANPYKYYNAYIYPDGTLWSNRSPYSSTGSFQNNNGTTNGSKYISQQLIVPILTGFGWQNSGMTLRYAPNYLGSICNLSQAIQKTTTTSMKVTYTLRDVTE